MHPAVALALERLGAAASVGEVVRESGRSHRAFISLFRRAMGVNPKTYCRVQRFQRVIRRLTAEPTAPWADVALVAGYTDQPHFAREFRQLAGITPGAVPGARGPRPSRAPAPRRALALPGQFRTEARAPGAILELETIEKGART